LCEWCMLAIQCEGRRITTIVLGLDIEGGQSSSDVFISYIFIYLLWVITNVTM
jgi:hypothetical protein